MSNEWDDQRTGGQDGPGPQFDEAEMGVNGRNSPPPYAGQQDQFTRPPHDPRPGYAEPHQPLQPEQQPYSDQQAFPGQQRKIGQQFPPEQYWSHDAPLVTPETRSNALGISGLVIVVLATAALTAAAWFIGVGLGDLFNELAETGFPRDPDALMNDPRTLAYAERSAGPILGAVLAAFVGLVGWIISIVATATRRGRTYGIIGIILGVLSLPLAYATFTWVVGPFLA